MGHRGGEKGGGTWGRAASLHPIFTTQLGCKQGGTCSNVGWAEGKQRAGGGKGEEVHLKQTHVRSRPNWTTSCRARQLTPLPGGAGTSASGYEGRSARQQNCPSVSGVAATGLDDAGASPGVPPPGPWVCWGRTRSSASAPAPPRLRTASHRDASRSHWDPSDQGPHSRGSGAIFLEDQGTSPPGGVAPSALGPGEGLLGRLPCVWAAGDWV